MYYTFSQFSIYVRSPHVRDVSQYMSEFPVPLLIPKDYWRDSQWTLKLSPEKHQTCCHLSHDFAHYIQGVSKKMSFLGKRAITSLKLIQNANVWGCIGKFRIFPTRWALRFSKLKKKWLRKWSLKLPTPPPKMDRILRSQYTLIDPLSHSLGHYGPWTRHIGPRVQNYFYFTFY